MNVYRTARTGVLTTLSNSSGSTSPTSRATFSPWQYVRRIAFMSTSATRHQNSGLSSRPSRTPARTLPLARTLLPPVSASPSPGRPPVERAPHETVPWAQFARGIVSSGSSPISRGDGHVTGTGVTALRQNRQSWTCRRAPAIEGHYSNAGWLSSGMRLKYRPCTATSGPKNHPQVIEALLAELGQLGLGLARHASARASAIEASRDRLALPGRRPPSVTFARTPSQPMYV